MKPESDKAPQFAHALCLKTSNAETARLLSSGNILDESYSSSTDLFEAIADDEVDEDDQVASIRDYLDLTDDSYLLELFERYDFVLTRLVLALQLSLDVDDRLSWRHIEGWSIAMLNLIDARSQIDEFRIEAGPNFGGFVGFREAVSDLRSLVLVLQQLLPEDEVTEILDTAFNSSFAQILIDEDRNIPSELLFKLSKERRVSLSKTDPRATSALSQIVTLNVIRDETTQLIESEAHPKFVEKLTPLIPDKVQAHFEDIDSSEAAALTRLMEDFDPDNYSAILRAIIGSKYKVA